MENNNINWNEGISLEQLKKARELVANKWENLGLLDGLKGLQKEIINSLYESEPCYLISDYDGRIRNREEYDWTLELIKEYSQDEERHQEKLIVLRDLVNQYEQKSSL